MSMAMPWSTSTGSKPVTTPGMPYSFARNSKGLVPVMVPTWPGRMRASQFEVRVLHQRFQGAGHVLVRGEDAEVLQAHGRGALDGHGHQRRGGLEANANEHDLPIGVGLRQGQRIEGRIADLHATACGLFLEQARRAAGHARHVAERGYGHVRDAREGDDGVDIAVRRDAHGAARPDERHTLSGMRLRMPLRAMPRCACRIPP